MNNNIEYIKKYLDSDDLERGMKLLEDGISPQYIVGNVDFYGNIIDVDKRVLIPRFETELLVDKTISYIKKYFKGSIDILDMCTGSGCIAISLKKNLDCNVTASDISSDALDLALVNANKNNVVIDFIESDIFDNINGKFDVIIANPPYIRYDEEIEDIVVNNEPNIALYAPLDGLYFYDSILKNCLDYLNDKFFIAFEIGYLQGNNIKNLAYKYLGNDINISIEVDYSNRDRFVFIWN